jgi:hypothetical protein
MGLVNGTCQNCPAGQTSDGLGGPCKNCPAGYESGSGGTCLACPIGTNSVSGGQCTVPTSGPNWTGVPRSTDGTCGDVNGGLSCPVGQCCNNGSCGGTSGTVDSSFCINTGGMGFYKGVFDGTQPTGPFGKYLKNDGTYGDCSTQPSGQYVVTPCNATSDATFAPIPWGCPSGQYLKNLLRGFIGYGLAGGGEAGNRGTCTDCPVGYYGTGGDQLSGCIPCSVGTYSTTTGQSSCTSCPLGQTTLGSGSTSSSACYTSRDCPTGFTYSSSDQQCHNATTGESGDPLDHNYCGDYDIYPYHQGCTNGQICVFMHCQDPNFNPNG